MDLISQACVITALLGVSLLFCINETRAAKETEKMMDEIAKAIEESEGER